MRYSISIFILLIKNSFSSQTFEIITMYLESEFNVKNRYIIIYICPNINEVSQTAKKNCYKII